MNELLSKNVQIRRLDLCKATIQYIFRRHASLKEKHGCNQAAFINENYHGKIKIIEKI